MPQDGVSQCSNDHADTWAGVIDYLPIEIESPGSRSLQPSLQRCSRSGGVGTWGIGKYHEFVAAQASGKIIRAQCAM